ncbi:MAG: methyltransferase domain-containing protein [Hyphomonadaceae bacterium]|jgi:ubiquinone/menaquinone biosynthesis C-methylase UbiE|nr:methyltransferase domain-containing protein [Hyphomonadaceae bacterium]
MSDDHERAVARHYQVSALTERILKAAAAAGLDTDRLTPRDLGPIDEFHIGGRAATKHVVAKMGLTGSEHVLDIGCGIGGAARYLASAIGCRVTGIDLTPEYVEAARVLSARTGLGDRTAFEVASALRMPFADATFDAALTLHVAMNIKDRAGLCREAARVIKRGAALCIYDVMQGDADDLRFPMPWAQTPATSHLTTPAQMEELLSAAGFAVEDIEDRTRHGIAFFRERLAASSGPAPALGLQLLVGPDARLKFQNLLEGLERGAVAPVVMMARRRA